VKLDVGASAYWSEIATMQTMDNLLMQDKIDIVDYLERIPEGYISDKQELLKKLKGQSMAMNMAAAAGADPTAQGGIVDTGQQLPIPTGGGYSALQRAVNETGMTQ